MFREAFLGELRKGLAGLPEEELEGRLAFYEEMIDDRMEEGLTEETAVAEVGPASRVIGQILAEIPLSRIVREKVKPRHALRVWEILLLVLGSPIWLSLLVAAAAVVLSLYAALWAVVISLYAAAVSLVAGGAACLVGSVVYFLRGNIPGAAFIIGGGLAAIGLGLMLFIGCNILAKGLARGLGKMMLGCKRLLIRKKGEE